MAVEQIVSNESARQEIYKALAGCYRLPDESLTGYLASLHKNMERIDSKALPHVSNMLFELGQHDIGFLSVEYARLFVGPFSVPAPPYGSLYLENERKVMGDSTINALKHYHKFDLGMAEGLKELPDHISVELEFMYFLIYKEVESILSEDPEPARIFLTQQADFMTAHLCGWAPQFTDNMIQFSETAFYSNLGKATQIFLQEDKQFLKDLCQSAAVS
jgi:TorA maturation chaperone TorD